MVHDISGVAPYAVNFSIMAAIMVALTRKPLKNFLYQRADRVRDAVNEAAKIHTAAEERAGKARRAIENIEKERQEILNRERAEAESSAKELAQKGQEEAQRIAADATRIVGGEAGESAAELQREFLDMIISQAEEAVSKKLKTEDHSILVREARSSIEAGA